MKLLLSIFFCLTFLMTNIFAKGIKSIAAKNRTGGSDSGGTVMKLKPDFIKTDIA